jgi:hypothetical protein
MKAYRKIREMKKNEELQIIANGSGELSGAAAFQLA